MVSRRQAAWGESMRDTGAAVEVGEAGVWGMRGNLAERLRGLVRLYSCGLPQRCVSVDMVLIATSA